MYYHCHYYYHYLFFHFHVLFFLSHCNCSFLWILFSFGIYSLLFLNFSSLVLFFPSLISLSSNKSPFHLSFYFSSILAVLILNIFQCMNFFFVIIFFLTFLFAVLVVCIVLPPSSSSLSFHFFSFSLPTSQSSRLDRSRHRPLRTYPRPRPRRFPSSKHGTVRFPWGRGLHFVRWWLSSAMAKFVGVLQGYLGRSFRS